MAPKVDARRRAREAKARLDVERAERDRKIEEATMAFYLADDKIADLREEITTAEANRNEHVVALFGLGETADRIAVLTGLSSAEIRKIKRAPSSSTVHSSGSDEVDGNR
ncbi:hypothetical protein ACHAAC_17040 [Aeromicrobium sp. CF4.19]|uniref:hypothetical protein n=1 Tax=Aeromicrobium sp. CF4.19 TaxID=3373082 RepID=UPI003EE5A155